MEPNKTEKQTANDALISVVIPVYNTRDTLGACVESMLAQTHACFELLLLDDGSTDGSGALCDAYAQKDARVRVLHLDHAGVAAARNRGIDAARGDFIGFVDSDDTAEPAYLARLHSSRSSHTARSASSRSFGSPKKSSARNSLFHR